MSSQVQQIDFQGLLQSTVAEVAQYWVQQEMPEAMAQEYAGTLFQMGTIAVGQMQENAQIQIENAPDPIDVTPELAQVVVVEFVWGLQEAYQQAYKMGVPQAETLELIQSTVALYVFDQTKNIAVAAIGQKMAGQPMAQDQIRQYLAQTSSGAFSHFLTELEKQRGTLTGTADYIQAPEQQTMGMDLLAPEMMDESPSLQEPLLSEDSSQIDEQVVPVPVQKTQIVQVVSDNQPSAQTYHHVALGLLLSSLSHSKRQEVRQLFLEVPEDQLRLYNGLQDVPRELNSPQLLETIRQLKKLVKVRLQSQAKNARYYHERVGKLVTQKSYEQVKGLFVAERSGLQEYVDQFVLGPRVIEKPNKLLPQGVLQSLMQYIKKHFPQAQSDG